MRVFLKPNIDQVDKRKFFKKQYQITLIQHFTRVEEIFFPQTCDFGATKRNLKAKGVARKIKDLCK